MSKLKSLTAEPVTLANVDRATFLLLQDYVVSEGAKRQLLGSVMVSPQTGHLTVSSPGGNNDLLEVCKKFLADRHIALSLDTAVEYVGT